MIVVCQWMIKPVKKSLPWKSTWIVGLLLSLYSCNPTQLQPTTSRGASVGDDYLVNKAYVYKESPFVLGDTSLSPSYVSIAKYIDKTPVDITSNNQLTANCGMTFYFYGTYTDSSDNCVRSFALQTETQPLARQANLSWVYKAGTAEFYQTATLYHLNRGLTTFFDKLSFAYNTVQSQLTSIPKSIPSYLKDSKQFWFKGVSNLDSQQFQNSFLASYALCANEGNASFSSAGPELCFGSIAAQPNFHVVQDPSVIYHEFGHSLVSVMMNLRNATASATHPFRSNLGKIGFNEGSSLNEGVADYYSYVMTKRTHFGEWALGQTFKQSRPMSERDPIHISGLSTTSEGRLSYPQYILYDPNYPTKPIEDEHYAGQITSHYLVALTESLKSSCGLSSQTDGGHGVATSYMMLLLAETFSELGDLNAKGVDEFSAPFASSVYFNNLDPSNSYLWTQFMNPPTFRRFYQVFAKNIYKYISSRLCTTFTKDQSEKLLDDYGLLLFKNYNNNGNSTKSRTVVYNTAVPSIPLQSLTSVSDNNRRKSVLVAKQQLDIASKVSDSGSAIGFYIIDNRTDMVNLLSSLLYKGYPVPLSTKVASTDFNNGNVKVSPGEVVAVIPNLFNSSNSTIAGIHVLAQDWDHVDITDASTGNFKPCVVDNDVTVDQGGTTANTCTSTETNYNRNLKNKITGLFPTAAVAPVCLVQLEDGTSTRWVSQNEYRKKQGLALQDKDCLGYSASGTTEQDFSFNPHECLVRFLPGASDSFFSKIDSRKTFYDSVVSISEKKQFNVGNLMIMEVNKWIPPGTKFKCRLRASFSNCTDCFVDAANANDDYQDSEYMGGKPFKVLNFDFDVND
jgi:hypothetical protein